MHSTLGFLPYYYTMISVNPAGAWPDPCQKNLASGKFKVFIDSEYKLADFEEAYDRVQSNKAVGRVVVNVV